MAREALDTPLTRLLGIEEPIIQAPIGSATTPELAAAVSNAGGMGSLALSWTPADAVGRRVAATRALTDRPFAINLVLEWDQGERLARCLDAGARVVSTFWGDPGPYRDAVARAGALHLHTVGSVDEAERAAEAGVDAIVAQGWEAGGHVRGATTTLALVPMVADAVAPLPVAAAGGIVDGRGVAAALALGAQAAWMGTRFLLADEANVHEGYRAAIRTARDGDTVHATLFDGGWPRAPHRVLRTPTVAAWEAAGRPAAPDRPGEGDVVARYTGGRPLVRYGDDIPIRGVEGDVDALALYAGQAAALVHEDAPAADIVRAVAAGARRALA